MPPNPSPIPHPASRPQGDVELLERLTRARSDLLAQVGRRIVGQHQVLDGILTAIFSGGHALLLGVPGLAKTLMVQTVAQTLDLKFSRIQLDRKSTRLNSSHQIISYAVFCLKKKKKINKLKNTYTQ